MNDLSSLVFCDRVSHVNRALKECHGARIVALTPQVVETCEQLDLSYILLDTYVSASAVNRVADAMIGLQYDWAAWLDEELGKAVPEFCSLDFKPAAAQIAFLKRTIDYYLLPATVLREFFDVVTPVTVFVFERPPFVPALDASNTQRPLHALLIPSLAPRGTRVEVLPDTALGHSEVLGDTVPRRTYLLLRRTAGRFLRALKRHSTRRNKPERLVAWVGITGPDIDYAIALLERRGIKALRPPRGLSAARAKAVDCREIRIRLRPVVDALISDKQFWTPIDAVSSALREVVAPFLRRWLLWDVPTFWAQFLAARDWLSASGVTAAVGIEVEGLWTSALCHAAKSLGLPRVARIHNGGLFQDLPAVDCYGPTQSDFFLVNGTGDAAYLEELARRYPDVSRAVNIPVGSPRLDGVAGSRPQRVARLESRLRRGDTRPLVLYVPTMLMGCYRYFCEGYISDSAYVILVQRILRCFSDFPDVRVLYKPMARAFTRDPIPDFIARELSNVEVIWGRLTDVMWAADAIVIDFSATAITEAVVTDKPLVVHAGRDWARMLPQGKTALEGRALISETIEEFETNIRTFLAKGTFEPVTTPAHEFIRLYCTYLEDGRSAERMADVIAELSMRSDSRAAV